jgi:hypothetical protein
MMKFSPVEIQPRKALAIAALGLAASCGVAACGTGVAAASGSRPHAAPTDNAGVARDIANIAVGKGGLAALGNGVAWATLVVCDPGTVSNPPGPDTPTSASCGINYSDGSVWKRTVTVTFNGHGTPVIVRASLGTEILPPTAGQL